MLQILLSWLLMGFTYYAFGGVCLHILKFCNLVEQYNKVDRLILGFCLITVILNICSLFLPINHYLLFVLLALSVVYCIFSFQSLKASVRWIKARVCKLSTLEIIFFLLAFFSIAVLCLWGSLTFDPAFYHYQNIAWIENFATVPGLANLEDRFGFNSNIFVHYSLFSLRFLFGQPVYITQAFFAAVIFCQIISELIKSQYNTKSVSLLIVYLIFILSIPVAIVDSWTDIIPNLFIFYLVYQAVLHKGTLKNKIFLYFIVPIALVTFKLSVLPFCIVGLYILYLQMQRRKFRNIVVLLSAMVMILIPWLIRNVIISGYLVYPLYEIDLFSVDWKVPSAIAALQRDYMALYANNYYTQLIIGTISDMLSFRFTNPNIYVYVETSMILLSFVSLLAGGVIILVRRKTIGTDICIMYISLLASVLFWLINARDYRFAYGILSSAILIAVYLLIPSLAGRFVRVVSKTILGITLLAMCFYAYRWGLVRYMDYLSIFEYKNEHPINTLLKQPLSVNGKKKNALLNAYLGSQIVSIDKVELRNYVDNIPTIEKQYFHLYSLNNQMQLYISTLNEGCSYDYFPCVANKKESHAGKMEDLKNIEARGTNLSDGFRTKKSYDRN